MLPALRVRPNLTRSVRSTIESLALAQLAVVPRLWLFPSSGLWRELMENRTGREGPTDQPEEEPGESRADQQMYQKKEKSSREAAAFKFCKPAHLNSPRKVANE